MKPEKLRDANKKLSSDPNYNSRTIYVPEDFKQGLTPVFFFIAMCLIVFQTNICIIIL